MTIIGNRADISGNYLIIIADDVLFTATPNFIIITKNPSIQARFISRSTIVRVALCHLIIIADDIDAIVKSR